MFCEEDIIIPDNNVDGVIKEKNVEFDKSSDHGLSKIKYEFEEEETKILYGVLENQIHGGNIDKCSKDISNLQVFDGEFTETIDKIDPSISNMFSTEDDKIKNGEVKRERNEEFSISLDYELSNIKCEFDEEETKIQYDILESQLPKENVTTYSTDDSESACSQKTDLAILSYKCKTCGKCFTRNGNLNIHMRTHTGEKPYKCEICGKRSSCKQYLKKHIITHTGEKPHKCETCGKSFIQKSALVEHIRVHTGKKPYKCGTCGKYFNRKGNLNKHMRIYTGEKSCK